MSWLIKKGKLDVCPWPKALKPEIAKERRKILRKTQARGTQGSQRWRKRRDNGTPKGILSGGQTHVMEEVGPDSGGIQRLDRDQRQSTGKAEAQSELRLQKLLHKELLSVRGRVGRVTAGCRWRHVNRCRGESRTPPLLLCSWVTQRLQTEEGEEADSYLKEMPVIKSRFIKSQELKGFANMISPRRLGSMLKSQVGVWV